MRDYQNAMSLYSVVSDCRPGSRDYVNLLMLAWAWKADSGAQASVGLQGRFIISILGAPSKRIPVIQMQNLHMTMGIWTAESKIS